MTTDDFRLYQGDFTKLSNKVSGVDLILTSYDGFKEPASLDYLNKLAAFMLQVLKPGGVLIWISRDMPNTKGESFRHAMTFVSSGFSLHDTMIYKRANPLLSKVRYRQAFDYMFILAKGKPKTIHLLKEEIRAKDNSIRYGGVRENIWTYTTGREVSFSHLTSYPLALALDHIKTWTNENDTVLDPFTRSGTCGVASLILKRKFIGFEKEKRYLDLANARIKDWENESVAVDMPCFSDDLYEQLDV